MAAEQELYQDIDQVDHAGRKKAFGVCFPSPVWYHGPVSRRQAEEKLKGTPDGTYLFRDSTSSPADFVLSASEATRVSHYIIQRTPEMNYTIGDKEFNDLVAIVEFYKKHLLDTTTLTVPLPLDHQLMSGRLNPLFISTVRALYNFNANDPEDLSFRKGELLNILEMHEEQWWKAQAQSSLQIGVVPANYLEEIARGPAAKPLNLPARGSKKPLQRSESMMDGPAAAAGRKVAMPLPVVGEMYGDGPSSSELYGSTPTTELYGNTPTTELYGNTPQTELYGNTPQTEMYGNVTEERHPPAAPATVPRSAPVRKAPAPLPAAPTPAPAPVSRKPAPPVVVPPPREPSPPPPERPKFIVARASMDRTASAYDNTALSFKTGQIIHVEKQNENGLWEGSIVGGDGKRGHFPFTLVELMDSAEYDDDIADLERVFEARMDEIYS